MSQFFVSGVSGIPPGSILETLTGNDGVKVFPDASHNINILTANTTLKFRGTTNTETIDFGLINLVLGSNATNITSAVDTVGLGSQVFTSLTTGTQDTAIGFQSQKFTTNGTRNTSVGSTSLGSLISGFDNSAFGSNCLTTNTASDGNSGFGSFCLNLCTGANNAVFGRSSFLIATTSTQNTALGTGVAQGLLTGNNNILIGYLTAANYAGAESNNILIGNSGVAAENNKIRIGIAGSGNQQQNACFVAGITGTTVAGSPVNVSSTGQLGDLGFGTAGQILTSNGAGVSPTWQPSSFTEVPWTDQAASFNAAVRNGYFVTATATATMPASPSQGDLIIFDVDGVGSLLTIQANTGQIIRLGAVVSASAGTCVNNSQGDSITLVYRAADTAWQAISAIGTWTIT